MLFKDARSGDNLLKYIVKSETNALYLKGIYQLSQQGYEILEVVCDGRGYLIQALKNTLFNFVNIIKLRLFSVTDPRSPNIRPSRL